MFEIFFSLLNQNFFESQKSKEATSLFVFRYTKTFLFTIANFLFYIEVSIKRFTPVTEDSFVETFSDHCIKVLLVPKNKKNCFCFSLLRFSHPHFSVKKGLISFIRVFFCKPAVLDKNTVDESLHLIMGSESCLYDNFAERHQFRFIIILLLFHSVIPGLDLRTKLCFENSTILTEVSLKKQLTWILVSEI